MSAYWTQVQNCLKAAFVSNDPFPLHFYFSHCYYFHPPFYPSIFDFDFNGDITQVTGLLQRVVNNPKDSAWWGQDSLSLLFTTLFWVLGTQYQVQ